jgi:hypothetical protein
MTANRKKRLLRNLGGTFEQTDDRAKPFFDGPQAAEMRTSIVMVERIILAVLRSEVERLSADTDEARAELNRIFSHIFDPTVGVAERAEFAADFQRRPPVTVLGYPRTTTEMPCFAVILESDEEGEAGVLGKYAGQTLEDEDPPGGEDAEYEGAFFDQSYGIYIYAEHPDVCAYLYQFCKLLLFGARQALEAAGIIDPTYSGGELTPEEMYLPENMFARVLRIRAKSMMTVPRLFLHRDGRRLRVTGIFMEDVVVDGRRGGVMPYVATEGDEDA